MLIGPQGPPWWIFFQNFFKNVLVYPQLTQKYVLWHSKLEKSILGRRELNTTFADKGSHQKKNLQPKCPDTSKFGLLGKPTKKLELNPLF